MWGRRQLIRTRVDDNAGGLVGQLSNASSITNSFAWGDVVTSTGNGGGLARSWPKDGPPELWRLEIGKGYSAVEIEQLDPPVPEPLQRGARPWRGSVPARAGERGRRAQGPFEQVGLHDARHIAADVERAGRARAAPGTRRMSRGPGAPNEAKRSRSISCRRKATRTSPRSSLGIDVADDDDGARRYRLRGDLRALGDAALGPLDVQRRQTNHRNDHRDADDGHSADFADQRAS